MIFPCLCVNTIKPQPTNQLRKCTDSWNVVVCSDYETADMSYCRGHTVIFTVVWSLRRVSFAGFDINVDSVFPSCSVLSHTAHCCSPHNGKTSLRLAFNICHHCTEGNKSS